jgi:hypothetical protein
MVVVERGLLGVIMDMIVVVVVLVLVVVVCNGGGYGKCITKAYLHLLWCYIYVDDQFHHNHHMPASQDIDTAAGAEW